MKGPNQMNNNQTNKRALKKVYNKFLHALAKEFTRYSIIDGLNYNVCICNLCDCEMRASDDISVHFADFHCIKTIEDIERVKKLKAFL
jgi:hypothetical protein